MFIIIAHHRNQILFLCFISTLDKTEKIKYIEYNLFGLYRLMQGLDSFVFSQTDWYSCVMSEKLEWPNFIFDIKSDKEIATDKIEQLVKEILNQTKPPFIIIRDDASDFIEAIKQAGYLHVMRWPGMFLDIQENYINPVINEIFEIKQVNQLSGLEKWIETANRSLFPTKGLDAGIFSKLLESESVYFLLAYVKDKPAGTILAHVDGHGCMGIYVVSTLEEYRGRGLMKAMVNHTVNLANFEGVKYLVLEANLMSYNSYSKLGFEAVCNYDIFWKPFKNN